MNEQTGNIREIGNEPLKLNENLIPIGQIVHMPEIGWFRIMTAMPSHNWVVMKGIPAPAQVAAPPRPARMNRAARRRQEAAGRKRLKRAKKGAK